MPRAFIVFFCCLLLFPRCSSANGYRALRTLAIHAADVQANYDKKLRYTRENARPPDRKSNALLSIANRGVHAVVEDVTRAHETTVNCWRLGRGWPPSEWICSQLQLLLYINTCVVFLLRMHTQNRNNYFIEALGQIPMCECISIRFVANLHERCMFRARWVHAKMICLIHLSSPVITAPSWANRFSLGNAANFTC